SDVCSSDLKGKFDRKANTQSYRSTGMAYDSGVARNSLEGSRRAELAQVDRAARRECGPLRVRRGRWRRKPGRIVSAAAFRHDELAADDQRESAVSGPRRRFAGFHADGRGP